MRFTALAFLLLLSATLAFAAPQITSVEPAEGFVHTMTSVTIRGTDLSPEAVTCGPVGTCPVTVMFGNATAIVETAAPTFLVLQVPPQQAGRVDITVRSSLGQTVLTNGFTYSESARGTRADYVQYLVPFRNGIPASGAHGSRWETEWTVHNDSMFPLHMIYAHCAPLANPCFQPTIAPGATHRGTIFPLDGGGKEGGFVYVPKGLAPLTTMALRVRDTTRDGDNFGTEIPIVRVDTDYTTNNRRILRLIDVPTDPRYRATLRVYSSDQAPHLVHVSVYSESSSVPIERYDVELRGIVTAVFDPFPHAPAYIQLDPLSPAVRAAGQRVRIEVEAYLPLLISPPLVNPIWGFVSLTNNVTQQVTTITPHP